MEEDLEKLIRGQFEAVESRLMRTEDRVVRIEQALDKLKASDQTIVAQGALLEKELSSVKVELKEEFRILARKIEKITEVNKDGLDPGRT